MPEELKKEEGHSSGESSAPKDDSASNEGQDPLKNEEDEDNQQRLKEIEERLVKSEEEKDNYKKAFLSLKEKQRQESFQPPVLNNPDNYQTDENWNDDDEHRFASYYQKQRQVEKAEERKKAVKIAFDRFCQENSSYLPENDLNDMNYNKLKTITDKMYLGDSVEEIYQSLKFAHRGLENQSQARNPTSDSEVGDSGIGDTTGLPIGNERQSDDLTRPLNKWEKEAAAHFPGGETAYRKRLAERKEKKS